MTAVDVLAMASLAITDRRNDRYGGFGLSRSITIRFVPRGRPPIAPSNVALDELRSIELAEVSDTRSARRPQNFFAARHSSRARPTLKRPDARPPRMVVLI